MLSSSLPLIFKAGVPYTPCLYQNTNLNNLPQKSSSITHVLQFSLVRRGSIPGSFSTRHEGSSSLVAFGAKNAGSGEDNKALEAVLKLYTALRNRNITELSEVIGEECRCVCNFISIFQPFYGKKTHVPLGKGYSFHMCHSYQGKVTIRNVEMFMEPLLHIDPLRLKLMGFVMTIVDKIGASKGKLKRAIYFLLALALMTALLFII
ncbi:hypothetical protein RHGRI_004267 [Rhododendron griersonianum]|uniref:Uncharacterized protein n=1 Tax=Rhododendron griersonianum TaxID=479676 RepID=A0AAV6L8A5_9ERIC|nr:hypothetical protein RHGRI_004267 [Rhododendron griersonianum]